MIFLWKTVLSITEPPPEIWQWLNVIQNSNARGEYNVLLPTNVVL